MLGLGAFCVQFAAETGGMRAAGDKVEIGQRGLLQLLLPAACLLIKLARPALIFLGFEDGGIELAVFLQR